MDYQTMFKHTEPIGFAQHYSASGGDNDAFLPGCGHEDLRFKLAKPLFSYCGEKLPNRLSVLFTKQFIGIDEIPSQQPCYLLSNSSFPSSRKPDEKNTLHICSYP